MLLVCWDRLLTCGKRAKWAAGACERLGCPARDQYTSADQGEGTDKAPREGLKFSLFCLSYRKKEKV